MELDLFFPAGWLVCDKVISLEGRQKTECSGSISKIVVSLCSLLPARIVKAFISSLWGQSGVALECNVKNVSFLPKITGLLGVHIQSAAVGQLPFMFPTNSGPRILHWFFAFSYLSSFQDISLPYDLSCVMDPRTVTHFHIVQLFLVRMGVTTSKFFTCQRLDMTFFTLQAQL